MKKIFAALILVFGLVFTSCSNTSIPIPHIGDTMESLEKAYAEVNPDIDKQYPNIWVLEDYYMLIEFENNVVKHVYSSFENGSSNAVAAFGGICDEIGECDGNTVYHSKRSDRYYYEFRHLMKSEVLEVTKAEAEAILAAGKTNPEAYKDAECIIKNEDALDDATISTWRIVLPFILNALSF